VSLFFFVKGNGHLNLCPLSYIGLFILSTKGRIIPIQNEFFFFKFILKLEVVNVLVMYTLHNGVSTGTTNTVRVQFNFSSAQVFSR
jgi:hypothetical protein